MPTQGKATQAMTRKISSKAAHQTARRTPVQTPQRQSRTVLPLTGRGRWNDIAPFVGVSRETWRQLVNTGRAPTPQRLTERCSLYDFAAIHAWIANPASYNAAPGSDAPHLHKPSA